MNSAEVESIVLGVFVFYQRFSEGVQRTASKSKIVWMRTILLHFCQAPRVILEFDLCIRGNWILSQWKKNSVHLTLNSFSASCRLANIYTTPQLVFAAPLWNKLWIIPSFPTRAVHGFGKHTIQESCAHQAKLVTLERFLGHLSSIISIILYYFKNQ